MTQMNPKFCQKYDRTEDGCGYKNKENKYVHTLIVELEFGNWSQGNNVQRR